MLAIRGPRGLRARMGARYNERRHERPGYLTGSLCGRIPPRAILGVEAVLTAIRTGGKTLRGQIAQIRNRFESELAYTHGDLQSGKTRGRATEESPARCHLVWQILIPRKRQTASTFWPIRAPT